MAKDNSFVMLRRSMTKKEYAALCRKNRGVSGFNTGTKTFKSEKDYRRRKRGWEDEAI